jgi:hypothetical protein
VRKKILALVGLALALIAVYWGFESLVSDAATRLAYQIRNQALSMRASGETRRTFVHSPRSWPEGVDGAYRIEIKSTRTDPYPGHRSIGVARNLNEPPGYWTSYHLNYVEVPEDVEVAHQKGEPTLVTLEMRDGRIVLTALK